MIKNKSIFELDESYLKVQMSSQGLFLGDPIGKSFNNYKNIKIILTKFCNDNDYYPNIGDCLLYEDTCTIITKEFEYEKSKEKNILKCIEELKLICIENSIEKLVLIFNEKLKIYDKIEKIFSDTKIQIFVSDFNYKELFL